jgi:hypothetical protein
MNGTKFPYANTTKYVGVTLDAKLRWKEHVKEKKSDELNIKFRKTYWLLGRNSELPVQMNSYCPVWSFGTQLWGYANDSNIEVIKHYQKRG